ncbi:hypothetical protein MPTK1_7g17030 [Marchantia polymorpha subsp. ruderalis]|uniref:DUF4371 domain-containing protein n=2 Tax=Marchantia polymorpha TaxID=3197 RepID=A0AAF6C0M7_MARPO|nr:hypothetical protein MARPO_0051s0041 [Marchantia polymorpha]BBN17811.1 hypothetical protein Mp_7g17030 [Marchantia polymorpha subsp. ruderalis]|eukprot:PTQ38437.1 hypothetical protein MARPO_0051s0041 [Marchantia polymorpha]
MMTFLNIQKDILRAMISYVREHIVKQIDDNFFCLLIDETQNELKKKQMSLVLRFLDMTHFADTSSKLLMVVIVFTLSRHSFLLFCVQGQGYDGASNMHGNINGLKTIIQREVSSSYYVHCFAHKLALMSASKNHIKACRFFVELSSLCVTVGVSCKRADQFKNCKQLTSIQAEASRLLEAICNFDFVLMFHIMKSVLNNYVLTIRPRCNADNITCDYYYNVDIFFNIVESHLSERDDHFLECSSALLTRIVHLCPDHLRIHGTVLELVELGLINPHDFEQYDLLSLNGYFFGIQSLSALAIKMFELKKFVTYHLVFQHINLTSTLPVSTT